MSILNRTVGKAVESGSKSDSNKEKYVEPDTPFAGFETDSDGRVTGVAPSGSHLLVLGGPGSGKSRRVLIPQIITWDGPVCAVSAKGDLAEHTAVQRAGRGGPVYVMDLTNEVDWDELPDDVIPVVNDPCALLLQDKDGSTDDSALDLATLLMQLGSLGMSQASGSGSGGDSAMWQALSQRTLACLLQAGGWYPDPDTGEPLWGGGIDWVLRASIDYGTGTSAEGGLDLETANWDTAAQRAALMGSGHAPEIAATKALDPRQRDSVGINIRVALSSWQKRSVRGDGTQLPFSPVLLEDPNATFYMVAPSSGSAAGAATSVIESLVNHWMLHAKRKLPHIALICDELPQTAPWPRLAEHVGLTRSYGISIVAAAQASSQFEPRWGHAGLKILRDIFPAILVLIGAPEKEILDQAAWMQPGTERRTESTDSRGRQSNLSSDRVETYTSAELLPKHRGEGRLLVRGRAGRKVKLADYAKL
jgi:hypothetical protein